MMNKKVFLASLLSLVAVSANSNESLLNENENPVNPVIAKPTSINKGANAFRASCNYLSTDITINFEKVGESDPLIYYFDGNMEDNIEKVKSDKSLISKTSRSNINEMEQLAETFAVENYKRLDLSQGRLSAQQLKSLNEGEKAKFDVITSSTDKGTEGLLFIFNEDNSGLIENYTSINTAIGSIYGSNKVNLSNCVYSI